MALLEFFVFIWGEEVEFGLFKLYVLYFYYFLNYCVFVICKIVVQQWDWGLVDMFLRGYFRDVIQQFFFGLGVDFSLQSGRFRMVRTFFICLFLFSIEVVKVDCVYGWYSCEEQGFRGRIQYCYFFVLYFLVSYMIFLNFCFFI